MTAHRSAHCLPVAALTFSSAAFLGDNRGIPHRTISQITILFIKQKNRPPCVEQQRGDPFDPFQDERQAIPLSPFHALDPLAFEQGHFWGTMGRIPPLIISDKTCTTTTLWTSTMEFLFSSGHAFSSLASLPSSISVEMVSQMLQMISLSKAIFDSCFGLSLLFGRGDT